MFQSFKKICFSSIASFLLSCLFFPSLLAYTEEEVYHIGRQDVLDINVWQTPDLTKTVSVTSKGTISYPYLGDLYVAGKTPEEVELLLREKLSQGYVKDPQVSVAVKEYNSKKILVFGEAGQPGLYKLKGKIPVLEMLFMVSGVKGEAKRMTIIRPTNLHEDALPFSGAADSRRRGRKRDQGAKAIEVNLISLLSKGDLSENVMIQPGDTIYISAGTGEKYYVLGKVTKPGPYEWVEDITVLEAIKRADGALPAAALNRIQIRKNRGSRVEVIKLNVVDIMRGKKKDDIMVSPGDVIIVPESWI